MKRLSCYILLSCLATIAVAQSHSFEVRSFKLLQNDITAYINPVKDLNSEACALIKITGDKDFVFSAPLGIVKKSEEVGEIWIYLPKDSRKITIKHPKWGVLRDYTFPLTLESRLTYELVLTVPVTTEPVLNRVLRSKQTVRPLNPTETEPTATLPVAPWKRPKRPKEPLTYLAMANVSMGDSDCGFGGMFGVMRRHGVYARVLTNFRSVSTSLEADEQGALTDGTGTPYYTGKTHKSHHSFTVGGLHRLVGSFCLYEGIGVGNRTVAWETTEGERVKIVDDSSSKVDFTGELGGLWKAKNWNASAGVLTIGGSYWEVVVGVGLTF